MFTEGYIKSTNDNPISPQDGFLNSYSYCDKTVFIYQVCRVLIQSYSMIPRGRENIQDIISPCSTISLIHTIGWRTVRPRIGKNAQLPGRPQASFPRCLTEKLCTRVGKLSSRHLKETRRGHTWTLKKPFSCQVPFSHTEGTEAVMGCATCLQTLSIRLERIDTTAAVLYNVQTFG